MRVQAEVSLYPLRTGKLSGPVKEFCDVLRSHGLSVETRSMSTLVTGESDKLFDAVKEGFDVAAQRTEIVIDCRISNACPEAAGQKLTENERVD
ncbi:MAG: hypothetical protein A2Y76_00120 [Planctomycetes bacterium RBG_13_60_9]|nr:MAG: hypothetical protein A2Y76_00120 [Planctomycetes bacterium RBG_13_60_9]